MVNQRPLEEGYFTMPERAGDLARLVGSYSPLAETHFFPRRQICPITLGPVEDRPLSPVGVLYSWTFIYGRGGGEEGGHGVGQVDLPEGTRIQTRLLGRFGDWEIGMPMQLELVPVATDEEGNELLTFSFAPIADGAT
jgi:uncharacterized OB-fold protein